MAFSSSLQNLTAWNEERQKRLIAARVHLTFCAKLYMKQLVAGRLFLHEHPRGATSWSMREVQNIRSRPGVQTVNTDQCMFGLKTRGVRKGDQVSAKKATTFMTNSLWIIKELDRSCDGSHQHQALIGRNRAALAQRYPVELCRAICRGLVKEESQTKRYTTTDVAKTE